MPFKSEAQRRYLWANHPEIARRWAHEHGTPRHLPKKKGKDHVRTLTQRKRQEVR